MNCDNINNTIAYNIRKYRKQNNISKEMLSKLTKIPLNVLDEKVQMETIRFTLFLIKCQTI